MKIKAKNSKVFGIKLNVPVDGLIEIDANGVAEVSEKAAQMLVNGTNDWEYFNDSEGDDGNEVDEVINGLKKMTLSQMIDMANEAGYPESEYQKFAKKEKLMLAYLIKKYNEAKLTEGDGSEE